MARPRKYGVPSNDTTLMRFYSMHCRVSQQERHQHAEICAEWFNNFPQFKLDMGECPEGYSLERLDNASGYNPVNCKWIPVGDQQNNRRTNILPEGKGLKRVCEEAGVAYKTVWHRVQRQGMTPEQGILTKLHGAELEHARRVINEHIYL